MPFAATWMDLEIIIQSEVGKKEKDKYHMISLICGIYNMTQVNLSMKLKQTHREQTCGCQAGEKDWEFGISRCELLYIEGINNKILLYSTGNYIQYTVINHSGKEYEKEYIYNRITLLYTRNKLNIVNQLYFNKIN